MSEVLVPESTLNMDVVKFNVTDSEIAKMKEEYMGLIINGIEDKVGFQKVYKARQDVKKTRISLVKHADEMKEKALTWQRKVNAEKNRVVGELEAIEAHLQSEEDKIEAEKERIRVEAEKKEQERIQKRVDRLAEYGFKIDLNFLQGLDDAAFGKVVDNAKVEFEKEQEQKKEQERQRKLEKEKLEAERKELEQLRLKQAEAQRIIDANNLKLEEEKKKLENEKELQRQLKINARSEQLKGLGMHYDWSNDEYIYDEDLSVDNKGEVHKFNDEQWSALIEDISRIICHKKEDAEKKRQAEIEQARKESAAKALKDHKEAEERKKQDETERMAQLSDAEKFLSIIQQLRTVSANIPEMKSAKSKKLIENIKASIESITITIHASINKPAAQKVA